MCLRLETHQSLRTDLVSCLAVRRQSGGFVYLGDVSTLISRSTLLYFRSLGLWEISKQALQHT